MAVFQNRPYERHLVSNVPTLLAAGKTLADLAVGQIGIFDAKTNLSVSAPTFATNKALYIAQGTPDKSDFPEGAGVPNIYRKTHVIKGNSLKNLFGKKANVGQSEIVILGNTGIAGDTKTLTGKPGDTFYYYVRLTGDPIFNLNPDRSKGVIIMGAVQLPCEDACTDSCGLVDGKVIADLVVADYNTKLLPGGQKASKYAEANVIFQTSNPVSLTTVPFYTYTLIVPTGTGNNVTPQYIQGLIGASISNVAIVTQGNTVNGYTNYTILSDDNGLLLPDFTFPDGTSFDGCNFVPQTGDTFSWSAAVETCNKVAVSYELFIRGDECGTSFLTEIQAQYASYLEPTGVTGVVEDASGTCGFKYTLTTLSENCVSEGCAVEEVVFPILPDFNGVAWSAVALAQPSPTFAGIEFKSVYVPRVTREATFDQFAYQTDYVHIEVSSHDPDWRSTDICSQDPISTRIQGGKYPNGAGQAVARLEKADRMYDMDYFYCSPTLREAFDFYFETKFDQYYDQLTIEYEFSYSSNDGFGQNDHDTYRQSIWLPTTQATNLLTLLNNYAASIPSYDGDQAVL